MYVLADLEWVENKDKRISFSQIAMVRVDENWKSVSSIYRRIRPMDASFHLWKHVAFTGGSINDFLNAQESPKAFWDIVKWLCPGDTICWWFSDSKEWIQKLVPIISNRQIVLTDLVANFLGEEHSYNPYRIGKSLYLDRPEAKHDSRNDVEMMRRVLEHIKFPQPIPENIPKKEINTKPYVQGMAYHAHIATNTIHKKGCPQLPATGHLKGYNELTKPVSKGYVPCDCIKAEFRAARRQRNQNIIERTEYSFLYSPDSKVFHRRECKVMLNAKDIKGSVHYHTCADTGRTPCKICNPKPEHETLKHMSFIKNHPSKKKVPINSGNLSADEQRAINRHKQAQEQRKSVERNTALSPEKRDDLCTLSQPGYAFFAAKGYKTFHLRHCKKLSGITNVEGFPWYKDATRAGYRPCKCCKPDPKYDVVVSLPIYSTKRYGETTCMLKNLCNRFGYKYWEDAGMSYMETEVGIWKVNTNTSPYRLDHINLAMDPDNRTDFHRQPRLFLSLRDAFYYIKRHDEGLALTWKETAYVPKEAII